MATGGQPVRIIPRRHRGRMNPVRAGAIALLVITVATWLAFTKELPWRDPFQLHAVFQTSNDLRLDSPVRIAGVNVGEVVKVERMDGDSDLVKVTMEMKEEGLPIHKDATAKIRSRIFLEGNFFVELSPGTPSGEELDDGDTLPASQTSTPVQLDQVLTALQTNDREGLQDLLKGLGDGLMSKPTAAEDKDQDPDVRGETAAKSLNDSIDYAPDALRGSARVNEGLLGTEPRDLSKLIAGLDKVTTALSTNEEQLKDFITNFNRFFAVFAAEQDSLTEAIEVLGPTLENARTSLRSLNAALPDLEGFAREFTPGVAQTQRTIAAFSPWIDQATLLFSKAEAGRPAGRPAAHDALLRIRRGRLLRPVRGDQPHQPLLQRGDPARRPDGAARRRQHHRRPGDQGVLVHDGRFRQRRAGLRRQRLLHAHGHRRRRPARPHRQAVQPPAPARRALRTRAPAAAGHAAQAPLEGARDQLQARLLQEHAARPQRPRGRGRPARQAGEVRRA